MPRLQTLLASALCLATFLPAQTKAPAVNSPKTKFGPWLFAGFRGNAEDGIYYALSQDGYHWHLINDNKPVVPPTQQGELMRDPFLQRGADGTIHMVWTWGWQTPPVIGYASSKDLIHFTPHRQLAVMANEPTALNAWAPELYWLKDKKQWLILWSSTIPGRFPIDNGGDDPKRNHRIYATTTKDFTTLTPARLFFNPGYNVIDGTLLSAENKYWLIFKDERKTPLEKHLLTAQSASPEGPFDNISQPFTENWSEGPEAIAVPGGYLVYYDHYTQPQAFHAAFSPDMQHWSDATGQIGFPSGFRHGGFLTITQAEYDRLDKYHAPAQPSAQ